MITVRFRRHGVFDLSDRVVHVLRQLAFVGGSAVIVALAVLGLAGSLPHNPESDWFRAIEGPLQVGLLALSALGLVIAVRWPAPGAVLLALAGVGLGAVSAISHTAPFAVLVSVAFLVPAVLIWLAWQRHETPLRIAGLAIVTGSLLAVCWYTADAVHAHFFGPSHPESAVAPLDDPLVEWAWSGAVEPTGFTVVAAPRHDAAVVEVRVADPAGAIVAIDRGPVEDGVARMRVGDLEASTEYRYTLVVDGEAAPNFSGRVRTFPAADAGEAVTIAFASCARTGSSGQVFDAIRALDPNVFVITGDLHYENIARNDERAFAVAYEKVLTSPAQSALYRSVPIAYVWDDHDYSANDGDSTAASRPAARASYERTVPHAELVDDTTINQAFSVGSVRLVLIDTRSARVPGETLLGSDQLAWLTSELRSSSPTHDLVILVSPTPWIAPPDQTSDNWGGFAAERSTIADAIADAGIGNLVLVGGDAHMVAIDDGSNSDYSTTGGAGLPVLQAAALDRPGSVKGGPYSHGTFPGAGQYGTVRVERVGDDVHVELAGHTWSGTVLTSLTFEPT